MGKDRYFRQLDPKSYRIQGHPGQLFVVGLLAAITVTATLDLVVERAPEGVRILGTTTAGAAIIVVLISAAAGIGRRAAWQR